MMGHRAHFQDACESDALTRAYHNYNWNPGTRKWSKRRFNKRARRAERAEILAVADQVDKHEGKPGD